MKLLITFEKDSNRVKGISFHPTRPWVLTSLHNGVVQLYDYRMKVLINSFHEHEGAVRGVNFHYSQPLFVSGGDDYKVKVWNYQLRKCLFTLEGHNDYVRTVEFHREQPWIVSAGDDQTIRIWNWQSQELKSVITGHHHYVMCASFHPTEDILISCSLDQEIRIWDISSLKHKQFTRPDFLNVSKMNKEIFGYNDVQVKFILQGHDRGVNWVSFHPTSRYIVSGADDKSVKIWRYTDDSGREVDTLVGHGHNVSCCIFHPVDDLVVSNSEDKSIKFWSLSKGQLIDTYKLDDERFWILASHPTQNLIAAGHDSGFKIFKLRRERIPWCYVQKGVVEDVLYVRGDIVKKYSLKKGTEIVIGTIPGMTIHEQIIEVELDFKNKVIIVKKRNNKTQKDVCELYLLPKKKNKSIVKLFGGLGEYCVFIGNKKFVYLMDDKIVTKSVMSSSGKKIVFSPVTSIGYVKKIYKAPVHGRLFLLTVDNKIYLFDIEENSFICNYQLPRSKFFSTPKSEKDEEKKDNEYEADDDDDANEVRQIIFDGKYMAIICRYSIMILNSYSLKKLYYVRENIKVKSGVFVNQKNGDDENVRVFIYTTLVHLKYIIISSNTETNAMIAAGGKSSLMKTLKVPIYLLYHSSDNEVYYFSRKGTVAKMKIDSTEYKFKLALLTNDKRKIKKIIKNSRLLGDSMIAYLYKQGFPSLAIKFVKDTQTKFDLAIQCNDLETATKTAYKIDKNEVWEKLAQQSLIQGNIKIYEKAQEKLKNYSKLGFFYFVNGQTEKLKYVNDKVIKNQDIMTKFYNSLLLGDVKQRYKIMKNANQLNLALIIALRNNFDEKEIKDLQKKIGIDDAKLESIRKELAESKQDSNIVPKAPLYQLDGNWPLLYDHEKEQPDDDDESDEEGSDAGGEDGLKEKVWGGNDLLSSIQDGEDKKETQKNEDDEASGDEDEAGVWGADGLNIGDDELKQVLIEQEDQAFVCPAENPALPEKVWKKLITYPAEFISVGEFEQGMNLLQKIFGIVNFAPLKDQFMKLYYSKQYYLPTNNLVPIDGYLKTKYGDDSKKNKLKSLPYIDGCTFQNLKDLMKLFERKCSKEITQGKFKEAEKTLTKILQSMLFIKAKKGDKKNYLHLLKLVTEYLVGIKMELARKELKKDDVKANCELSLYFTRCKIKKKHKKLTIYQAMTVNFKAKNFKIADQLADDLLLLAPSKNLETQARYVKKVASKEGLTDSVEIDFDKRNHFIICSKEWKPIYTGNEFVRCTFCEASAKPKYHNKLCSVCSLAKYMVKDMKKKKTIFDFNFTKVVDDTFDEDEVMGDDEDEDKKEEKKESDEDDEDNELF